MRSLVVVLTCLLALSIAQAAQAHPGHLHPDAPAHVDTIAEVNVDFAALVANGDTNAPAALGANVLPTTHCGPASPTADDTANAVHPAGLKQFKLVYAYVASGTNRYAAWRDTIQSNVSLISRFMANESGGRKAPRFDMGTAGAGCGADHVDIQVVALPNTAAYYNRNFSTVATDVRAAIGGTQNPLILADGMNSTGGLSGQASMFVQGAKADREDASNIHNARDNTSIIWVPNAVTPPANPANGYWPEGFLHEMAHTMGAVQWSAPHTSRALPPNESNGAYAHCWDGAKDIMCYDDGPLKGHAYETTHCASFTGLLPQSFDCNRDDYFNPDPAPGSRFDTAWNTFDSVFLADCPSLGKGCSWDGTSPTATVTPTVTGTLSPGQAVTANTGTWTGSPVVSHQWQREVAGDFADLAGETGPTLMLENAWAGTSVRLKVTAVGTTTEVVHSPPALVAEPPPANTVAPTVVGTMEQGLTVTATPGTWTRADGFEFYWFRVVAGTAAQIPGEFKQSYTLKAADAGNSVFALVVGYNSNTNGTQRQSAARAVAAPKKPAVTAAPELSGTPELGQTLTASGGTWDRDVSSRAYAWERNVEGTWTTISGATASTYALVAADVDRTVRVLVTATGLGGASDPAPSTPSAQVVGPLTSVAPPSFTGTAKVGRQLTGTAGTWTSATSVAHHWERRVGAGAWTAIAGATSLNHTLTSDDLGATVKLVSTAQGSGGPLSTESPASAEVTVPAPPVKSGDPVLTGTAKRTHTLSATTISWTGAVSSARRWERRSEDGLSWSPIGSEAGATYTLVQADVGRRVRVVQTATNDDGTTEAVSNESATVVDLAPPVKGGDPVLTGTAKRTHTLSATTISWTGAVSSARRWERRSEDGLSWSAIGSEAGPTYTLTADDLGRRVRVVQSATNDDGTTTAVSNESATVVDLAPPVKSGDPVLTGSAKRTRTLSATTITWTGAASSVRRWERRSEDGLTWSPIASEAGATYTLTVDDLGRRVRVVQSATNDDGTTTAISNESATVTELAPPVKSGDPVLTGTAKRTHTLSATTVTWTGGTTSDSRRWERSTDGPSWSTIAGATGATYTLVAADVGRTVRVVQSATNDDGTTTAISNESATVADLAPPVKSGDPVPTGTAKRTQSLSATTITWTGDASSERRWERRSADGLSWATIAGETASSYTLVSADVGRRVRVVQSATNADGTTTAVSNESATVVDLAPPVNTAAPLVSGTPQPGSTLTASPGSWTGTVGSMGYRWQRQAGGLWTDIAGATTSTYAPGDPAVGDLVRVAVTATGTDGAATASSAPVTIRSRPAAATPPEVTVAPPSPPPAEPAPAPAPAPAPPPPPAAPRPVAPTPPAAPQRLAMRGRTLLTFTLTPSGSSVALTLAAPVRLKKGGHLIAACVKRRCTKRTFTARGRTTRLPALRIAARRGDVIRLTLTGASGRSSGAVMVR